jgi:hypothetical protein
MAEGASLLHFYWMDNRTKEAAFTLGGRDPKPRSRKFISLPGQALPYLKESSLLSAIRTTNFACPLADKQKPSNLVLIILQQLIQCRFFSVLSGADSAGPMDFNQPGGRLRQTHRLFAHEPPARLYDVVLRNGTQWHFEGRVRH